MMLKKALTHKMTSCIVSHEVLITQFKCHFLGKNSSTLHACKINNFYRRHPKFSNCVFQTLYFHIMWKNFSPHKHFNHLYHLNQNFIATDEVNTSLIFVA